MPRATRIGRKYREIQLSSCLCSSRELLLLPSPSSFERRFSRSPSLVWGEEGKKETINKYSSVVPQSFFSPSLHFPFIILLLHLLSFFLSLSRARENSRLSVFHELVMSRHLDRELGRERRPAQTREKETDVSCSSRSLHSRSSLRRYLFPFFFFTHPLHASRDRVHSREGSRGEIFFRDCEREEGERKRERGERVACQRAWKKKSFFRENGKTELTGARIITIRIFSSSVSRFEIRAFLFFSTLLFFSSLSPGIPLSSFSLFLPAMIPPDDVDEERRGRTTMLHLLSLDSYRASDRIAEGKCRGGDKKRVRKDGIGGARGRSQVTGWRAEWQFYRMTRERAGI